MDWTRVKGGLRPPTDPALGIHFPFKESVTSHMAACTYPNLHIWVWGGWAGLARGMGSLGSMGLVVLQRAPQAAQPSKQALAAPPGAQMTTSPRFQRAESREA